MSKSLKFRSKFEARVWGNLTGLQQEECEYEGEKLDYTLHSKYTPDIIMPNGIRVEIKGKLTPEDRRKMIAVKAQHPDLDIRFVFMRANNPLTKGSPTSYAAWAERSGFKWAEGAIPGDWFNE